MMSRFSLAFVLLLAVDFAEVKSQPIILKPDQAEKEGRALIAELLSQKPAESAVTTGILRIRKSSRERVEIPLRVTVVPHATNWLNVYETTSGSNDVRLVVSHAPNRPNEYTLHRLESGKSIERQAVSGPAIMTPFANSDFWIADLGLDFFHWPSQLVLRKEMRRGRSCRVLQSMNANARPGGYARVLSWIDNESNGIVYAEAYNLAGKRIKDFAPKDFKKVDGQWQLHEMEIRNLETGSSTRMVFDLKSGRTETPRASRRILNSFQRLTASVRPDKTGP